MITMSLKVPPSLASRLEVAARRLQKPKSELVRDFIERGLDADAGGPSFHDRARGKCGMGRSGVRDLATNSAHLDDYGR